MDFPLGDLLSGIFELGFCFTSFGNGKDNSGCGIMIAIVAVVGLIGFGVSLLVEKPKPQTPPTPIVQTQKEPVKKETVSHWLGRKTKDSVIEFGKGVIGKD